MLSTHAYVFQLQLRLPYGAEGKGADAGGGRVPGYLRGWMGRWGRGQKSLCAENRPQSSGPFNEFHFLLEDNFSDVIWGGGAHAHRNTAKQAMDGLWTEVCGRQKQSNDPGNNQHNPQYANYWAPLTRKRHIPPHSAQPRHTNHWAPRTRKRHQQEHWPQRPTESSDPTQHAKGRTGDCPGPRKGATTRRNVTQGFGRGWPAPTPPKGVTKQWPGGYPPPQTPRPK